MDIYIYIYIYRPLSSRNKWALCKTRRAPNPKPQTYETRFPPPYEAYMPKRGFSELPSSWQVQGTHCKQRP